MSQLPMGFPPRGGQGQGPMPAGLQQMIAEYDRALRDMRSELEEVKADAAKRDSAGDSKLAPRFIEDIPGKRVPYWWVITVDVNSAITDGARWSGSQTLSQDGPFVINSTRAFWRVTTPSSGADANADRAFLPVSRYPIFSTGLTAATSINRDLIDWFFNFQLAGGDRLWQNSDMPGANFCVQSNRPEYYGMPGWVERNSTMTIQAVASVSQTAANAPTSSCRGTLYFVHSGYKILRPIDYAEAFGMNP